MKLAVGAFLIAGAIALAVALAPHIEPSDAPLLWDMSHHTLRTERFGATIRALGARALANELRTCDAYPPAIYATGGMLFAASGANRRAWRFFPLLAWTGLVLGLTLGYSSIHWPVAAGAFCLAAGNAHLSSLAQQRMLDFPSGVAALFALACLTRLWARGGRANAVLTAGAMTFALLSKHNSGLAVLPVGLLLAVERIVRRKRSTAWLLLAATLASGAAWAGFLSWQVEGWESFENFARNRANAEGWSAVQRLGWYLSFWTREGYGNAWVGGALLSALPLALLARCPFGAISAVYVVCYLVPITFHPYLLDRNLTSVEIVAAVPIASGLWFLLTSVTQRRRVQLAIGLTILVGLLISVHTRAERNYRRIVRPEAALLAPPSDRLAAWFGGSQRVLLLGSFNELSAPWMELLWERRGRRREGLQVELPYPFERGRSSCDPRYDDAYARILEGSLRDTSWGWIGALELDANSPFHSEDFRSWNAWKQNYVTALERSPNVLLLERAPFAEAGLTLSRYTPRFEPVIWLDGWNQQEDWGRWMSQEEAGWKLSPSSAPDVLILELAPHHEQTHAIQVEALQAGVRRAVWRVEGEPWRFQSYQVSLAPRSDSQEVTIRVIDLGRSDGQAALGHVLPVRRAGVVTDAALRGRLRLGDSVR